MARQFTEFRAEMRTELRRLEDKVDRHFTWLVGLMMTGFIGAAVVGLYFK